MKMSREDAEKMQFYVYLLTLDDYSPHGILGGKEKSDWKYAINLTYRCLASGLWKIWNTTWLSEHGINNYYTFCRKLSELDPFSLSSQGEEFWLEPFMCSTELSINLIKKFDINGEREDLCTIFVEEIEKIFEAAGVPWCAGDIFKVHN